MNLCQLGIVGRTGAGKSSIVAALFRMTDHMSGSIVIGGLDFSQVSLDGWRKIMTIIPQVCGCLLYTNNSIWYDII